MTAGNCIGTGSRGTVWLLRQAETDRMVAIKRISIPVSPKNVQALMFTGAVKDEAGAQDYYNKLAQELVQELEDMEPLEDCPNVLPFQGSFLTPKDGAVGFDLYLLSEYCETLQTYMEYNAMSHLRALNLAIDVCTALEAYRSAGLLHRNIKPSNIFVGPKGQYLLGDLGAVRLDQLDYAFIPDDQFNAYSAPETAEGKYGLNATIDIYSLGMVLYRIYNGGHAPLEDEKTGTRAAEARRISGEALPAPMYADYELSELILKACAPEPVNRFQTPTEFKQELALYMQRNRVSDDLIVPPLLATDLDAALDQTQQDSEPEDVIIYQPGSRSDQAPVPPVEEIPAPPVSPVLDQPTDAQTIEEPEDYPAQTEPNEEPAVVRDVPQPDRETEAEPPSRGGARRVLVPVTVALLMILIFMAVFIALILPRQQAPTQEPPAATEQAQQPAQETQAPPEEALPVTAIASMDARVGGTDTISISVQAAADLPEDLTIDCADSTGLIASQPYDPAGNTFTDLKKGTEYLFSLSSDAPLTGVTQVLAVTENTTAIESITPSLLTDTEVQLDFEVSGQMPSLWTLVLSDAQGEIQSTNFNADAVLLRGLNPGTEYTIQLSAADGALVIGQTSYTFTTEVSVTLRNFTLSSMGKDSVSLVWTASGSLPDQWQLTCEGSNGYHETQEVQTDGMAEVNYLWQGLESSVDYRFTLDCEGLKETELNGLEVNIPALAISDLAAVAGADGSASITWACDSPLAPNSWEVTVWADIAGQRFEQTVTGIDNAAQVTGLLPGTTYNVVVVTDQGVTPEGVNETSFTTAAAQSFRDYNTAVIAMVMWLKPDKDPFTALDLAQSRNSFTANEGVAFAIQANRGASDDLVNVLYVLRDAAGSVVAIQDEGEASWSSLWVGDVYVGSLDQTPQAPGAYTLEVYISGKLLTSAGFTIR